MLAYKSEWVELHFGDSLEVLESILKHTLDLLVTDPPYGQNYVSRHRGHKTLVESEKFKKIEGDGDQNISFSVISKSITKLKPNRHIYYFGPKIEEIKLGGHTELVWNKSNLTIGDLTLPWSKSWEPIHFGVYVPSKQNLDRGSGNLSARLRRESVLDFPRKNAVGVTKHPTEKPVDLLIELIEASSRRGEVVLDPFVGVGSTNVAAILCGRKSIGIELDEKYVDIALKRIKEAEKVAIDIKKLL